MIDCIYANKMVLNNSFKLLDSAGVEEEQSLGEVKFKSKIVYNHKPNCQV
jgi:hypothetical protein